MWRVEAGEEVKTTVHERVVRNEFLAFGRKLRRATTVVVRRGFVKPAGTMFAYIAGMTLTFRPGAHMGEVVRFVPKSDLERARLIREARAIYESIFPTQVGAGAETTTPPAKS